MTEQEIQALQDAKVAAETKAEEALTAETAAKEAATKAQSDLTGVVDELKEERIKKNEAIEKLNTINNPNPDPSGTPDVETAVNAALSKREDERIQTELASAIEEFKGSKTEFQTDTAGIVFDKFKKDLNKFNFSDVKSKEEARKRLEDAYRFLRQQAPTDEGSPEYEGATRSMTSPVSEEGVITNDVKKTLDGAGVTEEQYKKISTKYGDALAGLGIGQ